MEDAKKEIRKKMHDMRRRVPALMLEQKSGIIQKRLMETDLWKNAKTVYLYVSLPDEVDTKPLVIAAWDAGKQVAVPRVANGGMTFHELTSYDQLREGYSHIMEPFGTKEVDDPSALIVIPGVAFDVKKHRLGYGKGFYDKYLAAHPGHPTAALSFDFEVIAEVPNAEHDVVPDILITDRGILR